jgi:RHS repeat-associated protein
LPGQYEDTETGLHYNFNRYYDPQTGRYISQDPIGLAGGVNRFSYVNHNPLNSIDPTGEFAWGLAFAAFDLGMQLYRNGGNFNCVNWTEVGLSLVGGGIVNAYRKGAFIVKKGAKWYTKSGKLRNPHSWSATSDWMNKNKILLIEKGQQRHHWLLEQNQGIGKYFPDWIKNQPWNINPISAEFNNWLGRKSYRAWLGAPAWAAEGASGLVVSGVGLITSSEANNDCECR